MIHVSIVADIDKFALIYSLIKFKSDPFVSGGRFVNNFSTHREN